MQELLLPAASLTVSVTLLLPLSAQVKDDLLINRWVILQLSEELLSIIAAVRVAFPDEFR